MKYRRSYFVQPVTSISECLISGFRQWLKPASSSDAELIRNPKQFFDKSFTLESDLFCLIPLVTCIAGILVVLILKPIGGPFIQRRCVYLRTQSGFTIPFRKSRKLLQTEIPSLNLPAEDCTSERTTRSVVGASVFWPWALGLLAFERMLGKALDYSRVFPASCNSKVQSAVICLSGEAQSPTLTMYLSEQRGKT